MDHTAAEPWRPLVEEDGHNLEGLQEGFIEKLVRGNVSPLSQAKRTRTMYRGALHILCLPATGNGKTYLARTDGRGKDCHASVWRRAGG